MTARYGVAATLALAVATAGAAVAACSNKDGTLALRISTPSGQDPFEGATVARLTIATTPPTVSDFPIGAGGTLSGTLKPAPTNVSVPFTVELLDASGKVLARGKTPPLALVSSYTGTVDILVGKVNSFGKLASTLPVAVSRPSAIVLREGEAMLAGGLDRATPVTRSVIYDLYFYEFQGVAALPTARAGAAVLPNSAGKFAFYGGLVNSANGLVPTDLVEVYDASADTFTGGQGGAGARVDATVSRFPDETANWLVAGGSGPGDVPLATAAAFSESAGTLVATSPLTTPRSGHTATTVQTPRGPRLFLYGGNAAAAPDADAELFEPVARTFSRFPAPAALGRRRGHTATLLADGRVLLAGGRDENGAPRGELLLFDPQAACDEGACSAFTAPLDSQSQPVQLANARYGHAAFVVADGRVLIAAGRGADHAALKTAELYRYDAASKRLERDPGAPPLLSSARADFAAVYLSTGQILFAGGVDETNAPLASAELYFPP